MDANRARRDTAGSQEARASRAAMLPRAIVNGGTSQIWGAWRYVLGVFAVGIVTLALAPVPRDRSQGCFRRPSATSAGYSTASYVAR
jgi:hypothetical protein